MKHAPKCLKCQIPLRGHDAVDGSGRQPSDGDVAICWHCGEAMIFQGASFCLPTQEEFSELMADDEFSAAMAAVALKNSGSKAPAAVIISDTGHMTVLGREDDTICEKCGQLAETRPYGKRKPNGERMRVCWACASLDPVETNRAFEERIEGR